MAVQPDVAPTSPSTRLPSWINDVSTSIFLALIAASLAFPIYVNTLHNPFVYDDRTEIIENAPIRLLPDVEAVVRANRTRPILMLSYAINYAMGELDPFAYHLTNLLLHVLNVLLLFYLVRGLVRDSASGGAGPAIPAPLVAFAAAALFAVHPMLTEAVGYVSGRSEVLSGVFFLSSLLSFRQAFRGNGLWYVPGLALFFIGLGVKETMGMLPVVLLAYDRLLVRPPRDVARKRLWLLHFPLLLLVVLGAALRVYVYTVVEHAQTSAFNLQNGLVELNVLVRYLGLFLYPASQSIIHAVYPISSITDFRVLTSVGALLFLACVAIGLRRRMPMVSFGIVWFFVLLVPSASLILLAAVGEPMSEHRTYLASGGFFIAISALIARLTERGPAIDRRRLIAAGGTVIVLIAVLGSLTEARNRIWENPVRLWEDAARKAPRTWMAIYGMADAYKTLGDSVGAAVAYQRAIRLRPTETEAYLGLADVWLQLGRNESARQALRAAVERQPRDPKPRMALATVEERIFNNRPTALTLCRQVLTLSPGDRDALACVQRNLTP